MTAQRKKSSPYAEPIAEATGAQDHLLAILETIMREEVFHSTLDWQGPEEFAEGARKAHSLYLSTPSFYDMRAIHQRSRFRLEVLESQLSRTQAKKSPETLTKLRTKISLLREFVERTHQAVSRLAAH